MLVGVATVLMMERGLVRVASIVSVHMFTQSCSHEASYFVLEYVLACTESVPTCGDTCGKVRPTMIILFLY